MADGIILKAIRFAKEKHGDQKYGNHPYLYHISKVAQVGKKFGGVESDLVCCILHDTIEDTDTTYDELAREFGSHVAKVVDLVSNRPSKEETLKRIRTNQAAVFVKLCDRIANVSEGAKNDKYRKEHPLFKKILYRKGEFDHMWKLLDSLLKVR